jgi:hypothetical protein
MSCELSDCRWRTMHGDNASCDSPKMLTPALFNPCRTCARCPYTDHEPAAAPAEPPSLARRALNFATALARHAGDGFAKREQTEIDAILENHCKPCEFFNGTRCTHASCGCNISGERKFLNKLAWASEHCPIGKW